MGVENKFRVLIAGGSITGLALANMLQLYDIDYVVLEAYGAIAPQVGASIGLHPYGHRILDQLGLFTKIMDLCQPLDSFYFRNSTGKVIGECFGMNHTMVQRHGYPVAFLDRQMVLQVLYDNIKDKAKVLTNKRVQTVRTTDAGVTVATSDGSAYQGDILVGGDGIHSTVRGEMWRIANQEAPGWIPADEHARVPCDYGCLFGISNPCEGIEPGALNSVFRKHTSYFVNGGPGGRVYWFCFYQLPRRVYGDDIPSFTKEDEDRVVALHADDHITPTLQFRDLIANKVTSGLVPLQEYVFRQWHYGRIVTIGDAAHKFHPLAGHGGNACIESAATLVNALRRAMAASEGGTKPTLAQIERAFAATQAIRQARTRKLKSRSHEQQRLEMMETPMHALMATYLLPLAGPDALNFALSRNFPSAEKLDSPALDPAPRLAPYKDELLSDPAPRGAARHGFMAAYAAIACAVFYVMWVRQESFGLGAHLRAVLETGTFPYDDDDNGFPPLRRTYLGVKAVDDYLALLTALFIPGVRRWDESFGMLLVYFMGMLLPHIAVWTVEAFRKRNAMTPVALITLWLTLAQGAGAGVCMPLFYAFYTSASEPETYWWPLSREVGLPWASSMLWSCLLGYALPALLMFFPWSDPGRVQSFAALFQVAPMLAPLLCHVLGCFYGKLHPGWASVPRRADTPFPDVAHLKQVYLVMGLLGFALHVGWLAAVAASSTLSLASVFRPDFSATTKPLGEGLRAIFLADFCGLELATFVWSCQAVWDLRRVGRTAVDLGAAAAAIALANIVVGPGAALSAVWYWRETRLAKTSFSRGPVVK